MIYRARWVIKRIGEEVEDGEILVRNGRIADVGTGLRDRFPDEHVLFLDGCVLMPGLVNAHSHVEYTFSRGRADALNLWDWIEASCFGPGRDPDPETVRLSALLGAAEAALSGTTCLGDSTFTGQSADAILAVGLRGIAYREIFGQRLGDSFATRLEALLSQIEETQAGLPDRVRLGISPHSVYTSQPEMLRICAETCTELNIPVSMHLAETLAETAYVLHGSGPLAKWRRRMGCEPMVSGLTPLKHAAAAGILRAGVCLAHCVHISDEELGILAESGAGVAHCARSNAYLGAGIAPVPAMVAAGVPVGLGTDSAASCHTADMFEEMRFVVGIHRAAAKDAEVITAKEVLRLATSGSAQVLGLDQDIGTLEPGKRADFIAVGVSDAMPGEDLYLSLIRRGPKDIRLVVVDGCEIAKDGVLLTVDIDECRRALQGALGRGGYE